MRDSLQPQVDYLLLLAGMSAYVAALQLLLWRGRRQDPVYAWGSAWCLVATSILVGRWLQLGAADASIALLGDRLQLAGAALIGGVSVAVTAAAGARFPLRHAVAGAVVAGGGLGVATLVTDLVLTADADPRVDLLGRHYFEAQPGPLQVPLLAFVALCIGAAALATWRSDVLGDRERRGAFITHALVLAPLAINDVLYALHVIDTLAVIEFGFAFVVFLFGHAATQRMRRAHEVGDAVERVEATFRSLIEGSRDAVVVHRDGTIVFANGAAAELLGRADIAELMGAPMLDLVPQDDREQAARRLTEVTPLSGPSLSRERIRRPDGTELKVEAVRLAVVFDGLPGMAVILRDEADGEQMRLRSLFVEAMLSAQEQERRRIARELHDEAGQALTGVLLGLDELDEAGVGEADHARIVALKRVTESTLDDLGRLARGLHPAALEDLGFSAAIERHAADLRQLHGIDIDVEVIDREPRAIDGPIATALYRIAQEALTNAIRHGGARNISLVVHSDGAEIRATVEDDGRGFDPSAHEELSSDGGLGLHGIRERLALLGGTLEIDTEPGQGTTLFAAIPRGARPPSMRPPRVEA